MYDEREREHVFFNNKKLNEKEIMRNMEKKCKIKLHGPFECITHVYLSIIYFIKC